MFQKVRENARRASCQSNEQQIGLAFIQYTQDADEKYPHGNAVNKGGQGGDGQVYFYVKCTGVFRCPDDTTSGNPTAVSPTFAVSYGYNLNLTPAITNGFVA